MNDTERDLERRLKSEQEELFKIHRINERLMTECDQYHYERDVAVETLHKCYAATGEDAGDIGDFIALVDREKHTVNAVREMRKECDQWRECAERLAFIVKNSAADYLILTDRETAIAEFERLKEGK